jgi:hypothetical protein
MSRSITAALISALVFPGAGQLYLRRPLRACLFLLPTLAAVLYFLADVVPRATALAEQVVAGTLPLDLPVLVARVESQGAGSAALTFALWVIVLCWAASIVDAFVVARAAARRPE